MRNGSDHEIVGCYRAASAFASGEDVGIGRSGPAIEWQDASIKIVREHRARGPLQGGAPTPIRKDLDTGENFRLTDRCCE